MGGVVVTHTALLLRVLPSVFFLSFGLPPLSSLGVFGFSLVRHA
jgi:hypothetical protein